MRRRILFFASVALLGVFIVSNFATAAIFVPTANITVVKNTLGDEGLFNFELKQKINFFWEPYDTFDLQTAGNTASYNTFLTAFTNDQFLLTEEQQEGWSLSGIVCISDEPNSQFIPVENGTMIIPAPYANANITCTFTNQRIQEQKDPVIVIPGIIGSWNVPLSGWQLDPLTHIYDNLWEGLKAAGYEEGKDLFVFPYQWRVSNELTAYDLMRKIDEVQQISGSEKVDLVAHSMGGLVARYYIENELYLQDSDGMGEVDVDQIIFLGAPHLGATKSYLTWEAGEVGPDFPSDWIAERIFSVEAVHEGYRGIFEYVRGLPMSSVQELLPIYDYLKDKDTGIIREYPNNYPINTFLEDLNQPNKLEKLSQIRGLNIIGKMGTDSTIDVLRVEEKVDSSGKWEHGYPEKYDSIFFPGNRGLEVNEGDVTVPNRSNNTFLNWQTVVLPFSHKDLVTESQKIVIKELTGIEPAEIVRKNILSKWLFIKVHSPVDFNVTAPDGKRIGKELNSGGILNEIPEAFYSGFEGPEFVVIPNPLDGEYVVNMQGTGEGGGFELIVSNYNEANAQGSDGSAFGVIGGGEQLTFSFENQMDLQEPLEISREQDTITIDEVIEHVQALIKEGKFKRDIFGQTLIIQLRLVKWWDSKIESARKEFQKKVYKSLIIKELESIEKQLARLLEKDRVEEQAYRFLIEDINILKNNYE